MDDFAARLLLLHRKTFNHPCSNPLILICLQGVSTYTLTFQLFTDFSTLMNQFSAWTTQLGQANTAGYPYFLREMGVVGYVRAFSYYIGILADGLPDQLDMLGSQTHSRHHSGH